MKTCVIDTSVTVAWYLDESFSPAARVWQERLLAGDARLLVPSLHYWEFANVLRTLVSRGELAADLARDIFDMHLEAPLETAEPERRAVMDIALSHGASAYDAVFVALAVATDCPLVTAERTTTRWVTKLGPRAVMVR